MPPADPNRAKTSVARVLAGLVVVAGLALLPGTLVGAAPGGAGAPTKSPSPGVNTGCSCSGEPTAGK